MAKIYSYVLRFDDGAAPNPFWKICTLAICKPAIRRTAKIGDWIIGTGSTNTKISKDKTVNLSDYLVYAMKVTDKMSLEDYNKYCNTNFPKKIPVWKTKDWRLRMGDCIYYNFSENSLPEIRQSVHNEGNRQRDLSGNNALVSKHFYYFGIGAKELQGELKQLIKKNQGHRIIENEQLIEKFEEWIKQFLLNKVHAEPQLKWQFDKNPDDNFIAKCAKKHYDDDEDETEETIC